MSEPPFLVFEDALGFPEPGSVFYPESLRQVSEALAQLVGPEIRHPRSFEANIELYLDSIVGRFRSFHETHRKALAIHHAYRSEGRQYAVYLRSFSLGGIVLGTGFEGGRVTQQQGWSGLDRDAREMVKAELPAGLPGVSFVNTFDLYPSGNEDDESVEYMERVTLPSFRVLSHNWRDVVREVVRGARLIVLNAFDAGEGIDFEIELLREAGLAPRTVALASGRGRRRAAALRGFAEVIDLGGQPLRSGSAEAARLREAIGALENDGFVQTSEVADLSGLRCWVVDRGLGTSEATLADPQLAAAPYDHLIPSSLSSNFALLRDQFPAMVERWNRLEARMTAGSWPTTEELAAAMYQALSVFYLAATLEWYREMSHALATVGMAHRAITRDLRVMAACYRHATEIAGWSDDAALAAFLADASARLHQEIARR